MFLKKTKFYSFSQSHLTSFAFLSIFPIISVISCAPKNISEKEKNTEYKTNNKEKNFGENNIDKNFIQKEAAKQKTVRLEAEQKEVQTLAQEFNVKFKDELIDATVVRWRDGDTPELKFMRDGEEVIRAIRIKFIDTPEVSVQGRHSVGLEKEYAIKASNFAKTNFPSKFKFKLFLTGEESFDRLVGALFYGENNEKNYSSEIIKQGLAVPLVQSNFVFFLEVKGLNYYWFKSLAYAFNLAVENKNGFFSRIIPEKNFNVIVNETYKLRGAIQNLNNFLRNAPDKINYIKKYDKEVNEIKSRE